MGKVEKAQFAAYEKEARSWETGAVLALQKSTRTAWKVAGAGVMVGLLGVAAATLQANQEPPPPYVLRVDRATGMVERVESLAEGRITTSEATDKYFAQLYVRYRESWDPAVAAVNYYSAGLMSTAAEQQRYDALYRRSDQSPLKLYGNDARVRIEIRGTSFLAPGVASVRYLKLVERHGSPVAEVTPHTATVTFSYSSGKMSEHDRTINPLGFQADYRTDPDAPGLPPQLVSPAPAGSPDLRPLQARGQ